VTKPRYHVLALWLLGERHEADGWLEIHTRGPDLKWWESRCKVAGWNHRELTGSTPVLVRLDLAGGGNLSGHAYVDRAFHLRGDQADLKIHGTEQGFRLRAPGGDDTLVPIREALKQAALLPFRALVFLLVAVATIVLAILLLALIFAPETFLPISRPGF
jgi:hypothetical protein